MTQPTTRPFRSAMVALAPLRSSVAMPLVVSRKAPDSGFSWPRYCSKAAAIVAATSLASLTIAARTTTMSLMTVFSRRLLAKAKRENLMALITYLTRIQFDFGALKLLEAELQLLGIRRPLIVTDKGVIAAGLWAKVKDHLPGNMPLAIYDGTPENPTEAAMRDALAMYKDEGCDGIVAIGGGSPMDLAKAVGLMATHPGASLQPYAMVEGGAAKITPKVAPIVAIPTTSGTGSEVSRGGVIIMDSGRKLAIGSPHLIPKLALIDPELTMGLPPHLTAGTGMDAFTHNIECFMSNAYNPPADGIALDGLEKE